MKNAVIAFTGPFGETNFGDCSMIVNNIRSMSYQNIVLFSYVPVFNREIVDTYLANYDIEVVEVLLDDFDEKSHFPHTPVEILGRMKNLDVIKAHLRGVDKLVVNGSGYFNDEWTEGRMAKLFKIFTPLLLANQMDIPIIFTGDSLGSFDLGKAFFTNMFIRMKNLKVAARDQMYSKVGMINYIHHMNSVSFQMIYLLSILTFRKFSQQFRWIQTVYLKRINCLISLRRSWIPLKLLQMI